MAAGLTLLLSALCLALTLVGTYGALKHFEKAPPHLDAPFGLFPISVLKPLKGIDSGLLENLKGFFELDYPRFELIFSVADPRDPALEFVRHLSDRYPGVHCRIIVGEQGAGNNPKINNLLHAYEVATHDWVLISDSNVRAEKDYLKRLVAHLEGGVGMLTAVVSGRDAQSLGGRIEATYLNTFYARGMLLASLLGRPCVVGKCMLFQKSTAKRFGGIATLERYLAEDYMAGEAMRALGLRVIIARDPVIQHIGSYSLKEYWLRHVRWGRIRKSQEPLAFLFEPFGSQLAPALLGAFGLNALGVPWIITVASHLLIALFCDALLSQRLGAPLSLTAWLIRELLALPLWLYTLCGNSVHWRGKKMTIRMGGLLENA